MGLVLVVVITARQSDRWPLPLQPPAVSNTNLLFLPSIAEMIFTFVYVFISIGIGAYIVGTITLLVTKADEEKALYRNSMAALDAYSTTHDIPKVGRAQACADLVKHTRHCCHDM